ncbi:hypothetical protein Efla_006591 [Eimeria flavescens]
MSSRSTRRALAAAAAAVIAVVAATAGPPLTVFSLPLRIAAGRTGSCGQQAEEEKSSFDGKQQLNAQQQNANNQQQEQQQQQQQRCTPPAAKQTVTAGFQHFVGASLFSSPPAHRLSAAAETEGTRGDSLADDVDRCTDGEKQEKPCLDPKLRAMVFALEAEEKRKASSAHDNK